MCLLWHHLLLLGVLQRKLGFTFSEIRLRLGPKWLNIPLSPGQLGTKSAPLCHPYAPTRCEQDCMVAREGA